MFRAIAMAYPYARGAFYGNVSEDISDLWHVILLSKFLFYRRDYFIGNSIQSREYVIELCCR